MKIIINFLIGLLISLVSYAQQMDTILLLDYRENLPLIVRDGRGFGEDYLQIIINKNDTINLDAKVVKRKIKFKHKVYYNNNLKKKSPRIIFDNIQFAGLQIVKPQNEAIELQVKSLFHYSFKTKRTHEIDTIMKISKVSNGKLVLWNLYDFDSGMGSGLNYLYPRYTLHSHNWPTPAQLARRKKVRRQIERAIVYRYNTVTRQIIQS